MSPARYLYSGLLTRVFTVCARRRLVWPAVLLLPLYIRRFRRSDKRRHTFNLLILPKDGFNEDIMAAFGSDRRFNIYAVYRKVMKRLANGLLHPSLDDNNYCTDDPEVERTKTAYRQYLKDLWKGLSRFYRFDAVMTGNFTYFAEREFASAMEELGVPFVVLQKESLKTPGRLLFFHEVYQNRRGPFGGRKILVYNDIERKLEIDSGVVPPERIQTTGMPRLDVKHRARRTQARGEDTRPRVLFFSFGKKTGLPMLVRKARTGVVKGYERLSRQKENLSWARMARACHTALIRMAREHPEIEVVVKSKMTKRDQAAMYEALGDLEQLPPNLKVVAGGDPSELILGSRVVCGFNTTALFEAIAAGKPVVMPWFEEALDEQQHPYIVYLEDAVDYARSPEELSDMLYRRAVSSDPDAVELDADKRRVLDHWLGNPDGRAGERVRNAVLEIIASNGRGGCPRKERGRSAEVSRGQGSGGA